MFGNVSAVLMLKKGLSEEEGGLRERLLGPEWKAYLSRPSRWKSCFLWLAFRDDVNVCRKAESHLKKTDVNHFYLFMSKTRKHFFNVISCSLQRLAVLIILYS